MTASVTYKPEKGILITGASGFIGSTFTEMIMKRSPELDVYAVDAVTYAGVRENLSALADAEN